MPVLKQLAVNKSRIVLYADDDSDDKSWIRDACKAVNCNLKIEFVENGKQVLKYIELLSAEKLPSLIVVDLNMPEMDGKQTLKSLKAHPQYAHIPVAIVTTSSSPIDQDVCRRLGASVFLTKPDTYNQWQEVIRELEKLIAN